MMMKTVMSQIKTMEKKQMITEIKKILKMMSNKMGILETMKLFQRQIAKRITKIKILIMMERTWQRSLQMKCLIRMKHQERTMRRMMKAKRRKTMMNKSKKRMKKGEMREIISIIVVEAVAEVVVCTEIIGDEEVDTIMRTTSITVETGGEMVITIVELTTLAISIRNPTNKSNKMVNSQKVSKIRERWVMDKIHSSMKEDTGAIIDEEEGEEVVDISTMMKMKDIKRMVVKTKSDTTRETEATEIIKKMAERIKRDTIRMIGGIEAIIEEEANSIAAHSLETTQKMLMMTLKLCRIATGVEVDMKESTNIEEGVASGAEVIEETLEEKVITTLMTIKMIPAKIITPNTKIDPTDNTTMDRSPMQTRMTTISKVLGR